MATEIDNALLARIEHASLNASAPPQQRWIDGWWVRTCPGKAQRARSINAVALGTLPFADKLALALKAYQETGLPPLFRLTPFSMPTDLDQMLDALGWLRDGPTHVLVSATAGLAGSLRALPEGCSWGPLNGAAFTATVGALRGSSPEQQTAHADRLAASPVVYRGFAIRPNDADAVLCCGQFAREGNVVGLYDVHTAIAARRLGLAGVLCERMLLIAAQEGATTAYLQVESSNAAALSVYRRLGFKHAYDYHYRHAPSPV